MRFELTIWSSGIRKPILSVEGVAFQLIRVLNDASDVFDYFRGRKGESVLLGKLCWQSNNAEHFRHLASTWHSERTVYPRDTSRLEYRDFDKLLEREPALFATCSNCRRRFLCQSESPHPLPVAVIAGMVLHESSSDEQHKLGYRGATKTAMIRVPRKEFRRAAGHAHYG